MGRSTQRASCAKRNRFGRVSRRLALVLLPAVLMLSGCAHQQAYKRAEKLSQQGRYDQAIAELTEAIRLAEEARDDRAANRYRQELEVVKGRATAFCYLEAEKAFANADLISALDFVDRCIRYRPQEARYPVFRKRIEAAVADAEQLRQTALSLANERDFRAAREKMIEALRLHRTLPGGQGDLKQIQDRAYDYHMGQARSLLGQGNLKGAEGEAKLALSYREGGKEAKSLLQTVSNQREAAVLIERGRGLLDQAHWAEALRVLEKAERLHRSHADLPGLLDRARRGVCDGWIRQGRDAMAAGDYAAALRLFNRSAELLEGYGGAETLAAEARVRLVDTHLAAADTRAREGYYGCAALHAAVALGYEGDHTEARRSFGAYADQVRRHVRYSVAFVGLQTAPAHTGVGELLASAALEHLTHVRPANVVVTERVDLQPILLGRDLDARRPSDPQLRAPGGALYGVDAWIVGHIIDSRVVTETEQTGEGKSIYQDGYRPEPNPDYARAAAEVRKALGEMEQAHERLALAKARLAGFEYADPNDAEAMAAKQKARVALEEARQRLVHATARAGSAQLHLARIPREVLVPNMVEYHYPIETATWTATVRAMIKMADAAGGELILAERLEAGYAESDPFVAGDPVRNVPEDPLQLPPEATLVERAAVAMSAEMNRLLAGACAQHGERFAAEMRRAQAAGDTVRAVDGAVCYLFAYPIHRDGTDEAVRQVRSYLGEEDNLVDVRELLRRHGGLLQAAAEFPARVEDKDGRVVIQRFYDDPTRQVRCPCVLFSIDGYRAATAADLEAFIDSRPAGQMVTLVVQSQGRDVTTQTKLRAR